MTRPSRFEIMRRNRPKLAKARETLRQRIDRLQEEVEEDWTTQDHDEIVATQARLDAARERQVEPQRGWLQSLFAWPVLLVFGER